MKEAKRTLFKLIAGIVIYGIVISIAGTFLVNNNKAFILGVLYGCAGSIVMVVHLFFSLNKSLDLDSASAEKRENKMAMIRMIIMIVIAAIGFHFSEVFHVAGVLLGLFGLKISAYLQPFFS